MREPEESFKSLSLARHFGVPKDFRGCFGWMCGYSADAGFLDDAAERFTGQTRAQRAYGGRIALALMLDPGNQNISFVDAPGVMHLPIKNSEKKPFLLLHAKVAILGFHHETDAQRWQLRLIVSTGNWTRETLEDSLDLAWRIDLSSEDLKSPNDVVRQARADMRAAWGMLKWIRSNFDTRILDALPPGRQDSESWNAGQLFKSWIEKATSKTGQVKPRFFDNRKISLLGQLPAMIGATGVTVKRNYLAMGSGFYEAPSEKNAIPSVLCDIVGSLQNQQLLTAKPEIDVFVNRTACQAVAVSQAALTGAGFTIRPPGQPSDVFGNNSQRSLHAKFIFSANCRDNSNFCNSAWLYLGSGNLTGPGFCSKASAKGGNLEAGVVFAPGDLYWAHDRGLSPEQLITNVLPVQWETTFASHEKLSAGSDMPERDIEFFAAPIAWLLCCEDTGSCWLKVPDGAMEPFEVLNEAGEPCPSDEEGRFLWPGNRPRQVQLRWDADGKTRQSLAPVLDEFGRIAATALPKIDLDEAWWQLANFPMLPDDEDLPPEDVPVAPSKSKVRSSTPTPEAIYPTRQMMQLIENIAAKQTAVRQDDWLAWCARLEQCLIQASSSLVLKAFIELEINPLSPLWHVPFRPTFAETAATPDGQRYETTLHRVEAEWNVASFRKIGSIDETQI